MARKKKDTPLTLALEMGIPEYFEWVRTTPTRRLVRGVRLVYKDGKPIYIQWRQGL